jgi:WD40 repeat protein
LPQQSEKTLQGHRRHIDCLGFSPDDSNILASADSGCIKLWNVETEECIYNYDHENDYAYHNPPEPAYIRSMFFYPAGDEGNECVFVRETGALIRTSWNDLSDIESLLFDMPSLGQVKTAAFSHCGSFVASLNLDEFCVAYVILYSMTNNCVIYRVAIDHCMRRHDNFLAFSPDGKTLIHDFNDTGIFVWRVIHEIDEPGEKMIRRIPSYEPNSTWAVSFDPTGEFLASAGWDQTLRLCPVESYLLPDDNLG